MSIFITCSSPASDSEFVQLGHASLMWQRAVHLVPRRCAVPHECSVAARDLSFFSPNGEHLQSDGRVHAVRWVEAVRERIFCGAGMHVNAVRCASHNMKFG
uniref:Predicted protein n=1 Tax=Hordeum vulgare subsp. vulgare TaxID=112509 RepID=F2D0Y4_HORVV|nr:predicted protein [Hordeum vulgare subsp. vulgare]